jgi:hypothetical protein
MAKVDMAKLTVRNVKEHTQQMPNTPIAMQDFQIAFK